MVSFAGKSALRGLVAVAATASMVGLAKAEDTVTFVGWGGNGQDMMAKHWCEPFTQKTGIKCIQDGPTDYGKIKAMVEAGNTVWDVVDVEVAFAQKACADGLLEKLDYSVIDSSRVDPQYVFECGIGSMTWSWVNAYNKSELNGAVPTSWADFFDTEKYPGGRSVTKWIAPGMLEAALLADGVPPDQLYPLDIDRAFKKFDSIKDDIVWWSTAAEAQQQVTSGEAVMSMLWSGRAVTATQDPNVGVSWDQNLLTNETVIVPKGTTKKQEAMLLINQIVTAESQAGYANEMGYGPVNLDSGPLITPAAADGLPEAHTEGQIFVDPVYWRDHLDEVSERWYAWQAQ